MRRWPGWPRNTTPVPLADVLAARVDDRPLPDRAVLVTFDDAYADFATWAWPALRRHRVPATMFVPTAYPDTDRTFWWDRLHHGVTSTSRRAPLELAGGDLPLATSDDRAATFRRLRTRVPDLPHDEAMALVDSVLELTGVADPAPATLSWQQLGDLAGDGLTLAPHSRTHPLLHRLPTEALANEVSGSEGDLRARVPDSAPAFAYPGGGHDDAVVAAVADAGFELAFTTRRGVHDLRRPDWLRVRRLNVGARSTISLIRAQLLPVTHRVLRVANAPVFRRNPWN